MAKATVFSNSKRFAQVVDECEDYLSMVIYTEPYKALVIYDVPFKIRVQNITVPGYTPTDVPQIGIAIIGFNNYIL